MCGIVGTTLAEECPPELLARMTGALAHRGPDASGMWRDERVALGHRRLAILDPTPAGTQPMASPDGGAVIVYNGEVYNHRRLRTLLPRRAWASECDTETLLALYEHEGLAFLDRLTGMFAFALYDARAGRLFLVRDRLGIKPLYYSFDGRRLVFASELRALRVHPAFDAEIDPRAVEQYALLSTIPEPLTIHRGAHKLPAGHLLEYDIASRKLSLRRWWDPRDWLRPETPPPANPAKAIRQHVDRLEELLTGAVGDRTLSDVPLGCFLSGGIDSSSVALALSAKSMATPKTFCVGFEQAAYDESGYAARIAKELGTEHVTERLTSGDARALVPGIGRVLDEPFADASFLPSLLLCEAARRHVTVALSGDGGDEIFLGYDRYRWLTQVLGATEHVPPSLRRTAAAMLARVPHYRASMLGRAMGWKRAEEAYPWIFIGWNAAWAESLLGRPIHFGRHPLMKFVRQARALPPTRAAGYADLRLYLPDDILTKMDRASMWHSLEVRVPLLDHRIVQWSLGLPSWIQGAPEEPKRLLRLLLARHLPERLFRRPKAGFAVPLHRWLRGSLRPLLEEALSPAELRRHGLFDSRTVRQTMDRHFSGRWNQERQLWALLAFQLWYAENHR